MRQRLPLRRLLRRRSIPSCRNCHRSLRAGRRAACWCDIHRERAGRRPSAICGWRGAQARQARTASRPAKARSGMGMQLRMCVPALVSWRDALISSAIHEADYAGALKAQDGKRCFLRRFCAKRLNSRGKNFRARGVVLRALGGNGARGVAPRPSRRAFQALLRMRRNKDTRRVPALQATGILGSSPRMTPQWRAVRFASCGAAQSSRTPLAT
jgi:hypothetical protein